MAYERLVKKMTVENLWIYILSSLKLKPRYGYEIGRHIEKKYGFKLGKVTSYVILYRLVKEGLIKILPEKGNVIGCDASTFSNDRRLLPLYPLYRSCLRHK